MIAPAMICSINRFYRAGEQVPLEESDEKYESYLVPDNEKQSIRSALLNFLADNNSKVRENIVMIVTVIGEFDFPDKWSELSGVMMNSITNINSNSNINLVLSALQCFEKLAGYLTPQEFSSTTNALLTAMYKLLSADSSAHPSIQLIQIECIHLFSLLVHNAIEIYEGEDEQEGHKAELQQETKAYSVFQAAMPQYYTVLSEFLVNFNASGDNFALQIATIRCFNALYMEFPHCTEQFQPQVVKVLLNFLKQSQDSYQQRYIYKNSSETNEIKEQKEEEEEEEEENSEKSVDSAGNFTSLIIAVDAVFEFFHTLFEALELRQQRQNSPKKSKKTSKIKGKSSDNYVESVEQLFTGNLQQVFSLFAQFCLLSSAELAAFHSEKLYNELKINLLQSVRIRPKAVHCLEQITAQLTARKSPEQREGVYEQLCAVISQLISAANTSKNWRLRDLAIILAGIVPNYIINPAKSTQFNTKQFIEAVLLHDLSNSQQNPVLRASAIETLEEFITILLDSPQYLGFTEQIIVAIMECLKPNLPVAVRITATMTFGRLLLALGEDKIGLVKEHLIKAMELVCNLLVSINNDASVVGLLEVLRLCIDSGRDLAQKVHSQIIPLILQIWAKYSTTGSYELTEAILALFKSLAKVNAEIVLALIEQSLPVVVSILKSQEKHAPGTVEAALDIVDLILKAIESYSMTNNIPQVFYTQLLPLLIQFLLRSDSAEANKSGVVLLASFVRVNPSNISNSSFDNKGAIELICLIIARFLAVENAEGVECFSVGALITQLILKCHDKLGNQNILQLLRTVLMKLPSVEAESDLEPLLLVFARLINQYGPEMIVQLLQSLGTISTSQRAKKLKRSALHSDKKYNTRDDWEFCLEPVEINALQFLFTKWLAIQPTIQLPYTNKVATTALIRTVANSNTRKFLDALIVEGEEIQDNSSKKKASTRASTRRSGGIQYQKISGTVKVMGLLAEEWRTQKDNEEELSQDDEEEGAGEEEDEEEEDEQFINSMISKQSRRQNFKGNNDNNNTGSSPFAAAEDYEEIIEADERKEKGTGLRKQLLSDLLDDDYTQEDGAEEAEEEADTYPEMLTDPINQINLLLHIQQFFFEWCKGDTHNFNSLAKQLSSPQQNLLKQLLVEEAQRSSKAKQ
jgi:hypothetical protein